MILLNDYMIRFNDSMNWFYDLSNSYCSLPSCAYCSAACRMRQI